MTRFLTLLLVILSLGFSCKKDAGTTPDSKVSFSCQVNGKLWIPHSNDLKAPAISCYVGKDHKYIFIDATNSSGEEITVAVQPADSLLKVGKYILDSDRYMIGSMEKGSIKYTTNKDYTGIFEIVSLDKVNRKISAKFEFSCYNSEVKQEIKITNGVFNLSHYIVL